MRIPRPDIRIIQQKTYCYLSPVIFDHEHAVEQERGYLSRQQLADRHGVSLDRVIQWLALLNLSAIQQEEIISLGDYWEHPVVTERGLRRGRRCARIRDGSPSTR